MYGVEAGKLYGVVKLWGGGIKYEVGKNWKMRWGKYRKILGNEV